MEIFIHTYCLNHYRTILLDKFKKIKKSGLLDRCNKIHIPVFNLKSSDVIFFEEFKKLSPKIEVFQISSNKYNNECDTLNYIKKYVENFEENVPILYMHTKGVSYIQPQILKNIKTWNRYLDYYCIGDWKYAVEKLKEYNTVGPFLGTDHYSGNHYWINSDYIKTLPEITDQNVKTLNRGEYWIGLNKNLTQFELSGIVFLFDTYLDSFVIPDFFPEGF